MPIAPSLLEAIDETFLRARFVGRHKRFTVEAVALDGPLSGQTIRAHLADPGRLEGVLFPGVTLHLSGPYPPPRKLVWSVRLAQLDRPVDDGSGPLLVSLDSTLANRLVPMLVRRGELPELPGPQGMRREVRVGQHRFDLAWDLPTGQHLCEIKTVTHLAEPGLGAWPDAPSARGRRHLEHLIEHARSGAPASLVFVAGRPDIETVVAHRAIDPAFADLLREAHQVGVQLLGVRLKPTLEGPRYHGRLIVVPGV